jgi:hypothetical protein
MAVWAIVAGGELACGGPSMLRHEFSTWNRWRRFSVRRKLHHNEGTRVLVYPAVDTGRSCVIGRSHLLPHGHITNTKSPGALHVGPH